MENEFQKTANKVSFVSIIFNLVLSVILSIALKEAMYWYTRHYALKIDSSALMADAWHHRSDAISFMWI